MADRQRLVVVNRVIKAGGLDERGVDGAAIDLARNLARRIDKVGVDEAPLNLLRLYDSAVGKLQRAVERKAVADRRRDGGETGATVPAEPPLGADGRAALQAVPKDPLAAFHEKHKVGEARAAS